jgi:hypothetical protein
VSEAVQLDQAIATCLWLGNQEEIALNQFAEGHAKSDKVKEFVAMMIKDHRAALDKLQLAAPEVASLNAAADAARGRNRHRLVRVPSQMIAMQTLSRKNSADGRNSASSMARVQCCYIGQPRPRDHAG